MSPIVKIIVCLVGILVAGAPLAVFTAPRAALPAAASPGVEAPAVQVVEVPALVRYAEPPRELCILHEGRELCRLTPPESGCRWSCVLRLPLPEPGQESELEVRVVWAAQGAPRARALTLELSPPGLPAARDTQWAAPGEDDWRSIFTFKW